MVELEQAIQFINSFKARVDPECVFYHLVLNGFLRVTECLNNSSSSDSSSSVHDRFRNSSSSVANNISDNDRPFNAITQVDINPYPANFEGSFLIVFPNAGQNSLSGSSRVSRDFVTALNKAVTWLRSSLQLPSTKQGFTTALSKVCISKPIHCPASLIIERLIQRDLVRISYGGVLEFNTVHHRTNGQHVTVLQAPTFYTAAPIC